MSLLAWLGKFISHTADGKPTTGVWWTANILAAILFGLGHLPATAAHNDHHAAGRRPRAGVEWLPRNRFRLFLFQIWAGIRHAVPFLRRYYSARGVLDLVICFGKWTIHLDSENSPSDGGVFCSLSLLCT